MHYINWYLSFIENYKDKIIEKWLTELDKEFPNLYNLDDLHRNGEIYYKLLTEIHISMDEHSNLDIVPKMCNYHVENCTPLNHLLHSSHLWRRSLFFYLWSYLENLEISTEEIKDLNYVINDRIDNIQKLICETYLQCNKEIIKEKNDAIKNLHNERLNMLGKMAAGMAHEIRNPLSAIDGFFQLIRADISEESSKNVSRYLDIIKNELDKTYRQVTSFLSFSKNNSAEEPRVFCGSQEIVKETLQLIEPRCMSELVKLELTDTSTFSVKVQRIALQQVLSNLINNSIDALQIVDYEKKIIILTTEDEENFYIRIIDNGPGIPEELKETIFEPFTTSKEKGTGLGLAICKQIMNKNNGDITFSSDKGKTVFSVLFRKDQ